ncbi:MAG: TIGR03557 family F420-dependent LLM class oxidoreductase [Streptosporangiaceae bacterium]
MEIGYVIAAEEQDPLDLVGYARRAEEAGFAYLSVTDHYHPWVRAQPQSSFVWSLLGAIASATSVVRVGTGVTCPLVRIHPAVIAQAAATTARLFRGRFFFGIGTGENLNEHILGDRWPPVDVRLEMLREAVEIIRNLWSGRLINHHGRHYTVENAQLFTLPDEPPPIVMSALGPKAAGVAARVGEGYWSTGPRVGEDGMPCPG